MNVYCNFPDGQSIAGFMQPGLVCLVHGMITGGEFSTYHLVIQRFAMERSTIFKFGKPSISMGHLCHGYVK